MQNFQKLNEKRRIMAQKYIDREKLIEEHKRAIENISSEVEVHLSNLDWKVKFSAQVIEEDSYKELIDIILALPFGGVIIYTQEEITLGNVQEHLDTAGINVSTFKSSHDESSKKILKDFNEGRISRILSANSIKTYRINIRAVIFYGMPKSVEKLYKESIKCGQDGKPAKSIILWRYLDPLRIQKYKLRCNEWNDLEEYKNDNQYCLEMLDKMTDYCKTNLCRRSTIKNYFKIAPSTEIFRDTCCDNCEKIICERVSPCLIYEGVDLSNKIDISIDARLFLKCFKVCNCCLYDCRCILLGIAVKFQKPCGLNFFGAGRHKPQEYWTAINDRLNEISFIRMGNPSKITRDGNRYLRCKAMMLAMNVTQSIKGCLKRKNIHVTLENGIATVHPIEEVIYEDKIREVQNSKIFKSEKTQESDDFEFQTSVKPVLKKSPSKRKKVEEKKEKSPPPKVDWREAFAALVSRKDHEDIFKTLESSRENEQNPTNKVNDRAAQPGCSHWSLDTKSASSDSSNSFLQSIEEEEDIDDEYAENMRLVQELMHKRSVMPLDDLLDFIEEYISNNNAEEVAIKTSLSDDNLEECETMKVMRSDE